MAYNYTKFQTLNCEVPRNNDYIMKCMSLRYILYEFDNLKKKIIEIFSFN